MSLKGFHIVLISLSSIVSLMFGGWSIRAYSATGRVSHLAFAVFSFALAAGLVVYVSWFARKIRSREQEDRERRRNIKPLVVVGIAWLLSIRPAAACAVCYGEAEGPMIDAARLGVYLLFGLVLAMQIAFATFFFYLRKRSRAARDGRSDRAEESTP